jgi:alpha-tubulin suppressor-like RCC1 family protein
MKAEISMTIWLTTRQRNGVLGLLLSVLCGVCGTPTEAAPLAIQPGSIAYTPLDKPDTKEFELQEDHVGVFLQVFAGANHTCAVAASRRVWCWGDGSRGQLGYGNLHNTAAPVRVFQIASVVSGSAGDFHTCALTVDGHIWCWGLNDRGQASSRSDPILITPSAVPSPIISYHQDGFPTVSISAGAWHTCADFGEGFTYRVYCWGMYGPSRSAAMLVAERTRASLLSAGVTGTCSVIMDGGGLNCLVDIRDTYSFSFLGFGGGVAQAIDTGKGEHHCYSVTIGLLYCWGQNTYGQLGNTNAPTPSTNEPFRVMGLSRVSHFAVGQHHTCAVTNNEVWCWGRNHQGQLGDGTFTNRRLPTKVLLPMGVGRINSIAAGRDHTCIAARGGGWCWGLNASGQLGADAMGVNSPLPLRIKDDGI